MTWVVLFVALLASAVFSGSETGLYRLSQPRLEVEARAGRRSAKLLRYLLRRESAVLVTILVGNNLAIEILTWRAEALGREVMQGFSHELLVVLVLTPIVFLFAEALPKDLFRRRPYASMAWTADFLLLARFLLWPAERVLSLLAKGLEFVFGIHGERQHSFGTRESVERLLHEGTLLGALEPRADGGRRDDGVRIGVDRLGTRRKGWSRHGHPRCVGSRPWAASLDAAVVAPRQISRDRIGGGDGSCGCNRRGSW